MVYSLHQLPLRAQERPAETGLSCNPSVISVAHVEIIAVQRAGYIKLSTSGASRGSYTSIVAASELIGGVLGTIASGWITERFLQSRTLRTSALFTIGATLCFAAFCLIPSQAHWMWSALLIVSSAFFIYGPQALLGVSCSQYATKRAATSANGLCGIFGYAATAISGIGFGYLAGSVVLLTCWRLPADGYFKAEKVLMEIK